MHRKIIPKKFPSDIYAAALGTVFHFKNIYIFIYLAALGLSCGTQNLQSWLQDVVALVGTREL